MNIVFVSTWNVRCGIATYTRDLATALKKRGHNVSVLAEIGDGGGPAGGPIPSWPVWQRSLSLSSLLNAIKSSNTKPDIINFQNEYGLFPNTIDLSQTITKLKQMGIKVVTTLHTVKPDYEYGKLGEIIVHTVEGQIFSGGRLIPHGITPRIPTKEEKKQARKALGIPEYRVIYLAPGFINLGKNVHSTIQSFVENTIMGHLIVSGYCSDDSYYHNLVAMVRAGGWSNVTLDLTYASEEKKDLYFKAADVAILGRETLPPTPYSASGQMATAIGYGLPVLAQDVNIHKDHGGLGILYDDLGPFIKHVELKWKAMAGFAERARVVAEERSWDRVAQMYEEIYED